MDAPAHNLVEDVEDSSQEAEQPIITKKKGKSKKADALPPPPANTLTRFLAPGPFAQSVNIWDDVNRQCPVCQQAGFSSTQALALHVNSCLDTGANLQGKGQERDDAGTAVPNNATEGDSAGNEGSSRSGTENGAPAGRKAARKNGTGGGDRGGKRDNTSVKGAKGTGGARGENTKLADEEAARVARMWEYETIGSSRAKAAKGRGGGKKTTASKLLPTGEWRLLASGDYWRATK